MKHIYNESKVPFSNYVLHDYDDHIEYADNQSLPLPVLSETIELTSNLPRNHQSSSNSKKSYPNISAPITNTYETLQKPFRYDKLRGHWSRPCDFIYACIGHVLNIMLFCDTSMYGFVYGGVFFVLAFILSMLLYAMPLIGIQTYLGQFSSSGTIAAFRVSPLFKGFGYSILFLNLCGLTFYAVLAAVPLVYSIYALNDVIPWMSCNNFWNTANCSEHDYFDAEAQELNPHSIIEFFRYITQADALQNYAISWPLFCGMLAIWLMALFMLLQGVNFLGKFFRFSCIVMLSIFITLFIYVIMVKEINFKQVHDFFQPLDMGLVLHAAMVGGAVSSWSLGAGWGNIMTLASYNSFRRDGEKSTYLVGLIFSVILLMTLILGRVVYDNFQDEIGFYHYHYEEQHFLQFLCLCYAHLFATLPYYSSTWSFLFFFMLFLGQFNAVLVQCMNVLTAIFDEFEKLRPNRTPITIGLVATMSTTSLYFCTKHGFANLKTLPFFGLTTNMIISLVVLLMVIWVYGRDRFQCDLQFMLGKTINNIKMFLLRFVTPIFLIASVYKSTHLLRFDQAYSDIWPIKLSIIVFMLAIVYMAYKACQTTGTLSNRLRQGFKPHDWHPVVEDTRRFYDELMGISEMLVVNSDHQYTTHA